MVKYNSHLDFKKRKNGKEAKDISHICVPLLHKQQRYVSLNFGMQQENFLDAAGDSRHYAQK